MRVAIIAAVAAAGLTATVFAGAANAQCYWNGYEWGCGYYSYPEHRAAAPYLDSQPRWGTYGWDYGYARPTVPYAGPRASTNH